MFCTAFGAYEAHEAQVRPFESPSERPSMMPFIPSVITTAGTARYATPIPLARPVTSPSASVRRIAWAARPSRPSEDVTSRIAAPLSTQGTERSIPPTRMTNVWPAATKPTNEAITRMALTLAVLAKPEWSRSPTTNTRIAAPKA